MAISFTNAVNLSKEIAKKVVSSSYEWTDYLKATSNIYKYSFRDKLMIYAQRPDATACASMETWNKKLGHWVKAGSKGIALFRNNDGKLKLEYVFDISDTYTVRQAKPPNLWKLSEEHHQAVIEEFEKHYGIISGENFIDKLMKYAENFVEKNYDDYFHDLSISTKNSFLENIKKEDIEKTFKNILISSVQYTLLSRCGIDADNFFNEEDFKGIDLFNNAETFSYIGMAVSDLSHTLLHQTERAVKAFDKKKALEKQQKSIEKSEKIEYTNNKEFNTLKYKSKEEKEEKEHARQEQTAENINYGGNGNNIDGRKLALDQRIINPLLPDNPDSKVNTCVENIFDNWTDSKENLGTQLVFCDMSTPKGKKESNKKSTNNENIDTDEVIEEDTESDKLESNLYEDMKNKLIKKGIPKNEIAFIHDADTEAKKEKLFADVRNGKVRVLLGSRRKMGAGMNVQDRLMAIHHLDPPWRPGDLEQADGRGIRQGNENEIVKIYRYVTEGTFDAYSWAILENKQKFISQIMTSKTPVRSCEDVDATELSYAEVKALATGDTRIKDIMTLETEIAKLKILKSNFYSQKYEMEDKLIKYYPIRIQEKQKQLKSLSADLEHFKKHFNEDFKMEIFNTIYEKRPEAGEKILALCKKLNYGQELAIGKYKGFSMTLTTGNLFDDPYRIILKNRHTYYTKLGNDAVGNIRHIQNTLEEIPQIMKRIENKISELEKQVSFDTEEVKKEFPQEKELEEKTNRLIVLKSEIESKEKEEQDNTQEIEKTENNIIDVDGKEITGIKKEEKSSILGKLNTLKKEVKEINKEIQTSAHKKEEVTL